VTGRKLVRVLEGESLAIPPVWIMRQAGRYLPEYRETRTKVAGFLDLCYDPKLAEEVTLQPIRRFGFDAAILFSDILVVPDALGRKVKFIEGEGPRLDPMTIAEIAKLETGKHIQHLEPVIETVWRLRHSLPTETALIGFCGAPWTVATYMIAGEGSADQKQARLFAYREPKAFARLIETLVVVSAEYLIAQLRAGADAVMVFDSWAGVLTPSDYARWCELPVRQIVEKVRSELPGARFIGFPRGATAHYERFAIATRVNAVGLDWTATAEIGWAVQQHAAVQGNLDPLALLAGGVALDAEIERIVGEFASKPFVFNLGHGILPETPIANVEQMLRRVRKSNHA